jgi:hypothetical protein
MEALLSGTIAGAPEEALALAATGSEGALMGGSPGSSPIAPSGGTGTVASVGGLPDDEDDEEAPQE